MSQSRITGVKYIGKEEIEVDPLFKSGTQWRRGEVVNFTIALAEKLITKHFDMFEEAPVNYSGRYVMSVPGVVNPQPVMSINFNSMSVEQMRMFARMEYRPLPDGMPDDEVRNALTAMMIDAEEAESKSEFERFTVPYPVTADEYAALMSGTVELRLVPLAAPVRAPAPVQGVEDVPPVEIEPAAELMSDEDTSDVEVTEPVIEELLEAMNEDELRAFAKDHDIKVHHNAGKEKLREVIAGAIRERAVEQGAAEAVVEVQV